MVPMPTINEYSSNTFIARYQWQVNDDVYLKILKQTQAATELSFLYKRCNSHCGSKGKKNSYIYALGKCTRSVQNRV